MTTDRVFLVGILWALILLGLLILREVLRISRRPGAKVLLPALNVLVLVMVCAFSVAAVIYYTLFYRSRVVPRWLSGWGIAGALLMMTAGLLDPTPLVSRHASLAEAPEAYSAYARREALKIVLTP